LISFRSIQELSRLINRNPEHSAKVSSNWTADSLETRFDGFYFDGRSAGKKKVDVFVGLELIQISGDGINATWELKECQIENQGAPEDWNIIKGDFPKEIISVSDRNFEETLEHIPGLRFRGSSSGTRKRKSLKLVLMILGLAIGTPLLVFKGIPYIAEKIVPLIPVETDIYVGDATLMLLKDSLSLTVPAGGSRIARISKRLFKPVADTPYAWEIHFSDVDMVNAVSLPGGHIIVFKGLVDFAENDEEIAGVIAHEISHITLRHGMKALIHDNGLAIVLGATMGDFTGIGQTLAGHAQDLVGLSYSRDQERQADLMGKALLEKAGYSADGLASFFRRIGESEGELPAYLSSHPDSSERADYLEVEGNDNN